MLFSSLLFVSWGIEPSGESLEGSCGGNDRDGSVVGSCRVGKGEPWLGARSGMRAGPGWIGGETSCANKSSMDVALASGDDFNSFGGFALTLFRAHREHLMLTGEEAPP